MCAAECVGRFDAKQNAGFVAATMVRRIPTTAGQRVLPCPSSTTSSWAPDPQAASSRRVVGEVGLASRFAPRDCPGYLVLANTRCRPRARSLCRVVVSVCAVRCRCQMRVGSPRGREVVRSPTGHCYASAPFRPGLLPCFMHVVHEFDERSLVLVPFVSVQPTVPLHLDLCGRRRVWRLLRFELDLLLLVLERRLTEMDRCRIERHAYVGCVSQSRPNGSRQH